MVDAVAHIRDDLASEAQSRHRRGALLLALWTLGAVGLAWGFVPRADLGPGDVLAQAVAGAFILFGGLIAFSPNLRFGRWSSRGIAAVALLSPLLAARAIGTRDMIWAGSLGCMGTIVALGFVALVVGRIVLGRRRRRFGGAAALQGVGAAMVGSLAVGLHCPMPQASHLLTHVAGAAIVALLFRRLLLRA